MRDRTTPPAAPADRLVPFDGEIAVYAFRYALGRMTYAPSNVCRYLKSHSELLAGNDRNLIIREIDEAMTRGGLGHDCDVTEWMRLREHLIIEAQEKTPQAS